MYNRTDFKRCAVQDEAILKGMFSRVIGLQFLLLFFKKLLLLPTFGMHVEFFELLTVTIFQSHNLLSAKETYAYIFKEKLEKFCCITIRSRAFVII